MADDDDTFPAARITAIRGVGTSKDDELGLIQVQLNGEQEHAIAFDEAMADPLVAAVLQAVGHYQMKRRMRAEGSSTLVPGSPIPVRGANAILASDGLETVTILELDLGSGSILRFQLSHRSAETLAKRIQKKQRGSNLQN